jgi:hypothetical protein
MVVKIPKKLEMKSLLPAPCSPLPAHVLAFPGHHPRCLVLVLLLDIVLALVLVLVLVLVLALVLALVVI